MNVGNLVGQDMGRQLPKEEEDDDDDDREGRGHKGRKKEAEEETKPNQGREMIAARSAPSLHAPPCFGGVDRMDRLIVVWSFGASALPGRR